MLAADFAALGKARFLNQCRKEKIRPVVFLFKLVLRISHERSDPGSRAASNPSGLTFVSPSRRGESPVEILG